MEKLLIYQAFVKRCPEGWDANWFIGTLLDYEENEWFTPTNNNSSDYDICDQLASIDLIEKVRVPKWSDEGRFRGVQVQFRYKKDLQY